MSHLAKAFGLVVYAGEDRLCSQLVKTQVEAFAVVYISDIQLRRRHVLIRKLLSRYCDFLQSNTPIPYVYARRRRSPTILVALSSNQWSRLESSIAPKANPCVHVGL
jgi:hypothetical protein